MKKLLLVCIFILLSACSKSEPVAQPTKPPVLCDSGSCSLDAATAPATRLVSGPDWEVRIPANWTQENPSDLSIKAFWVNDADKQAMLMTVEPFSGNTEEYTLTQVSQVKNSGAKLISLKWTELNGMKYSVVESFRGGVRLWFWSLTKGDFGYSLSCAGRDDNDLDNQTMCFNMFQTLKLK